MVGSLLILLLGANAGVFSMAQMKGLGGSGLFMKAQETKKPEGLVITKELFELEAFKSLMEASSASARFLEEEQKEEEEKKAEAVVEDLCCADKPERCDKNEMLAKAVKESRGMDISGCEQVKMGCDKIPPGACPATCGHCEMSDEELAAAHKAAMEEQAAAQKDGPKMKKGGACGDDDAAITKMIKENQGVEVEGCTDPRVENYCKDGVWMMCPQTCGCCADAANPDGSGLEEIPDYCEMTESGKPRQAGKRVVSPKNVLNQEECDKCPEGPAGKPCRSAHCAYDQGFATTGPILVLFVTFFALVFGCGLFFMAAKSYKVPESQKIAAEIKALDEGEQINAEACGPSGRRGPSGLGRASRHKDGTVTFEAMELAMRDPEAAKSMSLEKEVAQRKQDLIRAEMELLEGRPSRDPDTYKPTEEAMALAMSNPEAAKKLYLEENVARRLRREELVAKQAKIEEDRAKGIIPADEAGNKGLFEMFHDMDRKGKTTGNKGAVSTVDPKVAGG